MKDAAPLTGTCRGSWTALAGVLVSLALLGCAKERGPRWIPIAEHLQPSARVAPLALAWSGPGQAEVREGDLGPELVVRFPAQAWERHPKQPVWHVPLALHLPPRAGGDGMRVDQEGTTLPLRTAQELGGGEAGFLHRNDVLFLATGDEAPPDDVRVRLLLGGTAAAGHLLQPGLSAQGVLVLPGAPAGGPLEIPPRSTLRFGTLARSLLDEGAPRTAVFRVRLDGEVVHESSKPLDVNDRCTWHALPLPAEGRARARLELEVDGAVGATAFLVPTLGPAEIGTRGARPWGDSRPDIVVFLADTFRADNLSVYGGTSGATPHLDRLADESLCFRQAWSTSSWTLPAHATLFTGHYPRQVLGYGIGKRLPASLETVVERLAESGYRTGAWTGGGFVSADFGFDQGFEAFVECGEDVERGIAEAEAFLAADDGRPAFLFVHTYRAHTPYDVSPETLASLGQRLGIQGDYEHLLARLRAAAREAGAVVPVAKGRIAEAPRTPQLLRMAAQLRAHYLGGVADLDRLVGGFLETLKAQGVLETGYFVFTSDHGEAFLDHNAFFHGGIPHDEQARIPLLVRGPGAAPGVVEDPVSAIDLAPTLARLGGLAPGPDWPGRSLLEPRPERALYGCQFESALDDVVFVVDGSRKVLLRQGGVGEAVVLSAYDLATDPGEQRDLAGEDPAWLRALVERSLVPLEELRTHWAPSEDAEVAPDKAEELRALGY